MSSDQTRAASASTEGVDSYESIAVSLGRAVAPARLRTLVEGVAAAPPGEDPEAWLQLLGVDLDPTQRVTLIDLARRVASDMRNSHGLAR